MAPAMAASSTAPGSAMRLARRPAPASGADMRSTCLASGALVAALADATSNSMGSAAAIRGACSEVSCLAAAVVALVVSATVISACFLKAVPLAAEGCVWSKATARATTPLSTSVPRASGPMAQIVHSAAAAATPAGSGPNRRMASASDPNTPASAAAIISSPSAPASACRAPAAAAAAAPPPTRPPPLAMATSRGKCAAMLRRNNPKPSTLDRMCWSRSTCASARADATSPPAAARFPLWSIAAAARCSSSGGPRRSAETSARSGAAAPTETSRVSVVPFSSGAAAVKASCTLGERHAAAECNSVAIARAREPPSTASLTARE
mmetsp:Transcript_36143/g.89026  ORF Transcript_36143/g.89026 Transcript_36143/m.89026 type:complete len:324 (+) Transcript_36143:2087-3058(+)